MCPAATKLSNVLQFVKASYCEGEIDTEGRKERSRWPLCPSYLPSFPLNPNLKEWNHLIPKLTVNWACDGGKASRHQSIRFSPPRLSEEAFFSPPCFARAYHLTQLLSRFWSLKKTWLWSNVSRRFTSYRPNEKARKYQRFDTEMNAGCNDCIFFFFFRLLILWWK